MDFEQKSSFHLLGSVQVELKSVYLWSLPFGLGNVALTGLSTVAAVIIIDM